MNTQIIFTYTKTTGLHLFCPLVCAMKDRMVRTLNMSSMGRGTRLE